MREELLEELGAPNNSSRDNGLQPEDMSIKADPGFARDTLPARTKASQDLRFYLSL